MEINAKLVKELRDKTSAGMMDCKRALIETNGDIEKATEYLRKKGLMDAAKKASRTAADGVIAFSMSSDKKTAAIVEVNSETDFVARNEKFQDIVAGIANVALSTDSIDSILSSKYPNSEKTVKEEMDLLISLVGENMTFRRAKRVLAQNGIISAYVHNAVTPSMGKIGVLVALKAEGSFCPKKTEELGKRIAMHIAAANPTYLCPNCVPQNVIDKEKEIILAQAKGLGKPENVAEKMAEGRIKKFFEESTLVEQIFVMDGKTKVREVVESFNKENGFNIKIAEFTKFVLGEGIEKTETNFAEEVQSFIK
ncbi:MAG: translation elongation factor Ts [Holosporales bacterium]|jgi:elongation factor Ts|nr:translation elongation factor Ts [Holosporales bacterium]